MRTKCTIVVLSLFFVMNLSLSAYGASNRKWQTGTLVAAERRDDAPEMERKSDTKTNIDIDGEEHTTSSSSVGPSGLQLLWMYYTIRSAKTEYVTRIQVNLPWTKRIKAEAGSNVRFAVEGNKLYVQNEDGSEAKAEIMGTRMAESAPHEPALTTHPTTIPGQQTSPSSCRVGTTKYCSGCSVSCTNGMAAKCVNGMDSPSGGDRCYQQSNCQCN